jgi:thiosulfate/3-mercaptopyruvate sulfurtransferase
LIEAPALFERLSEPDLRIVDCRFSLQNPDAGAAAYAGGHIPGATYAHLNHDLSGTIVSGKSGRHPLPSPRDFGAFLARSGIANSSRVVAYDDAGGVMAAARLWWLLRWVGHDAVWVLDGGMRAWVAHGLPVSTDPVIPAVAHFDVALREELVVSTEQVEELRQRDDYRLLDARAAERYRGDVEPAHARCPSPIACKMGDF